MRAACYPRLTAEASFLIIRLVTYVDQQAVEAGRAH